MLRVMNPHICWTSIMRRCLSIFTNEHPNRSGLCLALGVGGIADFIHCKTRLEPAHRYQETTHNSYPTSIL